MGWSYSETVNQRIARGLFRSPDNERQFDSDLNASFAVLAEMVRREVEIAIIHSSDESDWYVGFEALQTVDAQGNNIREAVTGAAQAHSLPSAICLAALSYLQNEEFNNKKVEAVS